MQKIIVWASGVALATAIVVAAITAGADSGDIVFIRKGAHATLNGAQKTSLGAVVTDIWPGAPLANVRQVTCFRGVENGQNAVKCSGAYERTVSSASYADLDIAGNAGEISAVNGDNVTFLHEVDPVAVDSDSKNKIVSFIGSVWVVMDIGELIKFRCERRGSDVVCAAGWLDSLTPTQYAVERQAGNVVKAVGVVQ